MEDEYDFTPPDYQITVGFENWFTFSVFLFGIFFAIYMAYKSGRIVYHTSLFKGRNVLGKIIDFGACCAAGVAFGSLVYFATPFVEVQEQASIWYISPLFAIVVLSGYAVTYSDIRKTNGKEKSEG